MPARFAALEARITPRGLVPFGLICHTWGVRLGPLAVQLGFLVASYALGVASGRQEALRSAPTGGSAASTGATSGAEPAT